MLNKYSGLIYKLFIINTHKQHSSLIYNLFLIRTHKDYSGKRGYRDVAVEHAEEPVVRVELLILLGR